MKNGTLVPILGALISVRGWFDSGFGVFPSVIGGLGACEQLLDLGFQLRLDGPRPPRLVEKALAEGALRVVIRLRIRGDIAKSDRLIGRNLDAPARINTRGVTVQVETPWMQHRDLIDLLPGSPKPVNHFARLSDTW